jgi:mevalonate kinase
MTSIHEDEQTFYAHGKLLLSGEYMVLKGAKALAIPLNKGQSLRIKRSGHEGIIWKAFHPGGDWFSAEFASSLSIKRTTDIAMAHSLVKILKAALNLKDTYTDFMNGTEITTHLEFLPGWGWGSSSTLISNIARWLNINPYELLSATFGGSGYDIACATASSSLFYQIKGNDIPEVKPTRFNPPFTDQLLVVYLNKKQSSAEAIKNHLLSANNLNESIERISRISWQMGTEESIEKFMDLMNEHESIISRLIGVPALKEKAFKDFPGVVKSLGAWGGDFFLALSEMNVSETEKYFQEKGLKSFFRINEITLNI